MSSLKEYLPAESKAQLNKKPKHAEFDVSFPGSAIRKLHAGSGDKYELRIFRMECDKAGWCNQIQIAKTARTTFCLKTPLNCAQ
jgi:hypothetical protein